MNLVHSQGPLNWVRISQQLGSRTPKQCRERYHQNLKPSLNHDPITPEEGAMIERLVQEIGKRWAEIARQLHGRSDNAVKNWWNGSQNRRKRSDRRKVNPGSYDERPEMLHYIRANMTTPRTLSMPPVTRSLPPPLMPGSLHNGRYHVETPLSSPGYSPASEHAPSLVSDTGSHYSTSPRRDLRSPGAVELPPLKMTGAGIHRCPPISVSPTDNKLPPLATLEIGNRDFAAQSGYFPTKHQSQLPTAPSSPQDHHPRLPPCHWEERRDKGSLAHLLERRS
jgi:Myb-like DNA-binding protein FlbD